MEKEYKNDEAKLARQLVWMGILLRRSDTVSLNTKLEVQRRLDMYDRLWEEDPKIQEVLADREVKGEAKGEIRGIQKSIVKLVGKRFPALLELAQQRVCRTDKQS